MDPTQNLQVQQMLQALSGQNAPGMQASAAQQQAALGNQQLQPAMNLGVPDAYNALLNQPPPATPAFPMPAL